ncbi:MAG: tryptophan synthase subunit alpha [Candidatus Baltobacteraceae bacterium]
MTLEHIFKKDKPAFIPYVMAGDPDMETTVMLVDALTHAGAAAIELGVPYGDPLADGPTIAAAGARALARGTGMSQTLELVQRVAAHAPPIVLFTYFNPVYRYGIERFARAAARAGAAGVIVPDVALEEGAQLRAALEREGLCMPLLIAPSTPHERAARIAAQSGGFVYVVSRLGVTGAASTPDFAPLREQLGALRDVTDKPLAVGFGISSSAHVAAVSDLADGFIVGSALIDAYGSARGEQAAQRAGAFARSLR